MANALYDKGRQGFLDGSIDWDTDNIRCMIVDSAGYTPNMATDDFLDDVSSSYRKGNNGSSARADGALLGTKGVTDGVASAADTTLTSVSSGDPHEYVLLYKDDGSSDTTSPLIALIDTASSGLPVTPNGGDITVQWDTGANKIFKL